MPCRSRCRALAGLVRAQTSDDIQPRALCTPPPKSFARFEQPTQSKAEPSGSGFGVIDTRSAHWHHWNPARGRRSRCGDEVNPRSFILVRLLWLAVCPVSAARIVCISAGCQLRLAHRHPVSTGKTAGSGRGIDDRTEDGGRPDVEASRLIEAVPEPVPAPRKTQRKRRKTDQDMVTSMGNEPEASNS